MTFSSSLHGGSGDWLELYFFQCLSSRFLNELRDGALTIDSGSEFHLEVTMDTLVSNHPNCFIVPSSKTDQYRHSFFVDTVLDWNHLDKCVAGSVTSVE